ncbi:MAG: hypothetical protein L0211_26135 [Planctomycetaceae bacterium]|nr:hypothetical protein [Planctomycetaceae bacterium]
MIDLDSTPVITIGECKDGMDISFKGEWGYHPLLVTLANKGEVLDRRSLESILAKNTLTADFRTEISEYNAADGTQMLYVGWNGLCSY